MIWLSSLLFLVSRLVFINTGNVFFDSKEYILRWSDNNLLSALTSGHPPLHSGYVLTFWPIFQISKAAGFDPVLTALTLQTLLAWLTVILFYKVTNYLIDKKTAFRGSVVFSVLPIFWIVNEAVMMETTYLFYWITSLFFLSKFVASKTNFYRWGVLSVFFWIMAFLTHTVVIMWIPLFIYFVWLKNPKRLGMFFILGLMAITLASFANALMLSKAFSTNIFGGFYWLYSAKFGEHAFFEPNIISMLRYIRNWITPLGYNNSWVLLLTASVGFLFSFKKNRHFFWLAFLWLIPTFITNQWWDSLLYGRHALIASFILAIMAVSYLSKKMFYILLACILVVLTSSVILLKFPIPYEQVAEKVNSLEPGGLLIDSHFSRPQTDGEYFGQIMYVDEPGWDTNKAYTEINKYLLVNKPVFITGQALSEPYGLFCGPYLHNLSLSYRNPRILNGIGDSYKLEKYFEIDSANNLDIFKISSGSGAMPEIRNLSDSRRRIDWLDPFRIISSTLPSIIGH